MKKSNVTILIVVLTATLVIMAGLAYISYELFNTPNFVSAFYGYARVNLTDAELIVINHSPLMLIDSKSGEPGEIFYRFDEYMLANGGFTKIPKSQMGSSIQYENSDGDKIWVYWLTEMYDNYVVWIIGEPKPEKN